MVVEIVRGSSPPVNLREKIGDQNNGNKDDLTIHDGNEDEDEDDDYNKVYNNNNNNNNTYYKNNNNNTNNNQRLNKKQLQQIKQNLLITNEVTFCDVSSDEDGCSIISNATTTPTKIRKRLSSTDTGDADSILSTPVEKKKPHIPDGGFGWMVVFASLLLSLIMDGISFSFGLLYTEFLVYFKESKSKTAWIGSLFLAIPLLSGPIMSNLVDKYGCRYMTIIGGVISGIGFALASVSNSVEMLYLTFGVIAGLGLGIGYVTAVVSIAFWFDKKRTFATGIGASGTGIGTFLYAPFTQYLLQEYGWRGTTLILAGTLFNICICGALMRDPDWLIEQNQLESRSQSMTTFSNSSVCLDEIKKMLDTGATNEAVLDTLVTNYNTEQNQQIPDPDCANVTKKYQSLLTLPTYLGSQEFENANIRHGSRRSLRRKPQDTTSKENILSISAINNNNANTNTTNKPVKSDVEIITIERDLQPNRLNNHAGSIPKIYYQSNSYDNNINHLASAETLNISDKVFYDNENENASQKSMTSLKSHTSNASISEGFDNFRKRYEERNQKHLNTSRLSLDETRLSESIDEKEEIMNSVRRSYRGTSLDVLFEADGGYKPELSMVQPPQILDEDNNLIVAEYSKNPNDIIIPIPLNIQYQTSNQNKSQQNKNKSGHRHNRESNAVLKRNAILRNSNYFRNMRIHRNSIHYRGAMLNTHRYRLRASSCPNIYRNSMTTLAREEEDKWYDGFVDIVKSIFDFSLFKDIKFCCIQLSTLLLFIWFIVPYFYITEHMLSYGYKEDDAALLISVIGVFNTIGMISLGWIGDQPWLNVPKTYAVCLVVCGFSIVMMPIVIESYYLLMLCAVLFGITFASSFSFTPIILVSLTDLDDFTCAYGLVLLVQGIGNLIGPPLAGFMYELTLRWDDSFYASGFFIALSGILAYATGILVERDENKKKNTDSDDNNTSSISE